MAASSAVVAFPGPETYAQADRPNVIMLMADDMGWGDVDFAVRLGQTGQGADVMYNGTPHWDMPNLSAMAQNGLAFSRMYSSSPVCSPTRGSVLTGRSPERYGIPFANTGKLENREVTAAEYAQALGYTTGHFGKWHLGTFTRDMNDANRGGGSHDLYSTALNNGFDVQYSTESKVSTYDPGTSGLTTKTRYWTGPGEFVPLNSPDLAGDDSAIIARETNAFIQQAAQGDEPFFAVSWFHTPHKPLNTPGNEDVDNLAAYTYAMEDLDTAIGAIRQQVQDLGIAEDTIILFTSDNGPERGQDYNNDPLREKKRSLYEGGVRVPGVIEWRGQINAGTTDTPMVTSDYLPTLMDIWGIDAVDGRPLDGQSMSEVVFNDREATREKTIKFKSTNGMRSAIGGGGRYKLISEDGGTNWKLYDLVEDYDEDSPLASTGNLNNADADNQAIYHALFNEYKAWEISVAKSMSNGITGDYQTRIAASNGVQIKREPPEDLGLGDVTGNTPKVYLERQHATLRQATEVDSDGSTGTHSTASEHRLDAGTHVNTFLIHLDTSDAGLESSFSITFEDEILGVIAESDLLAQTDGSLSFADPNFEPAAFRGLEADDSWQISEDGKTITFNLTATNTDLDELRVLTRSQIAEAVPEPSSLLLLSLGHMCLLRRPHHR